MMKFQSFRIFLFLSVILLIAACRPVKKASKIDINEILVKHSSKWTVEECDEIINFSSCSNVGEYWSSDLAFTFSSYDVFINAVRLDVTSIQAIVRKEAILKRVPYKDYVDRLRIYIEDYTNHSYDTSTGKVVKKNVTEDSLKGLSFKLKFINATDPYRPVDVEDGYEYFFLENSSGEFSRVVEISGDYADNHFFLSDYLSVIVTFSRTSDEGKVLFMDQNYESGYKLIFNALESDPIIIDWKVTPK
jgi:hypothetical protein